MDKAIIRSQKTRRLFGVNPICDPLLMIGLNQNTITVIEEYVFEKIAKSQNLNVSRLVLELSLPNPLKAGVKPRMKM